MKKALKSALIELHRERWNLVGGFVLFALVVWVVELIDSIVTAGGLP